MGMNSERGLDMLLDRLDYLGHLERHSATVGVAQDDAVDLGLFRRFQGLNGIIRIGLVAVEEMLGVVEHLRSVFLEILQ